MAKPYIIMSYYNTGAGLIEKLLSANSVIDAQKVYGKPEYNLTDICDDMFCNYYLRDERHRTRNNFDFKEWITLLIEAIVYYKECAKKDKITAYYLRLNNVLQKKTFHPVFRILKKYSRGASAITTVRSHYDLLYSKHRKEKEAKKNGVNLRPNLTDLELLNTYIISLTQIRMAIKKYNAICFRYPEDFIIERGFVGKKNLLCLGCDPITATVIFNKKFIITMPWGYGKTDTQKSVRNILKNTTHIFDMKMKKINNILYTPSGMFQM